jgi:hypothetical protein
VFAIVVGEGAWLVDVWAKALADIATRIAAPWKIARFIVRLHAFNPRIDRPRRL